MFSVGEIDIWKRAEIKGKRRVIEFSHCKNSIRSAKMDLLAEAKNNSDALVATEHVPCA
ncbi:MAG: hypothetical protein R2873_21030 [Caldilineaceae bacterium]